MKIGNAFQKLRRVYLTYKHLLVETGRILGYEPLFAVGCGGIGLLIQIKAIQLIFNYAQLLIKGNDVKYFAVTFNPRESVAALIVVCTAGFLLLVVSAVLTFYSNVRIVKLSGRFERYTIHSLVQRASQTGAIRVPSVEGSRGESAFLRFIFNDCRAASRAMLLAYTAVVPFFTMVGSALFLLWLDKGITTFLVPCVGIFLVVLYRVSLFGVQRSQHFHKRAARSRLELRNYLRTLRFHTAHVDVAHPSALTEGDDELREYISAYNDLIALPFRSGFASDLLFAFSLSGVLGILYVSSTRFHTDWKLVITYMIGLRYGVNALRHTATRFSQLNRFYPEVYRLRRFIHTLEIPHQESGGIAGFQARTSETSTFHPKSVGIHRGTPFILYIRGGATRFNAHEVVDAFLSRSREGDLRRHAVALLGIEEGKLHPYNPEAEWFFLRHADLVTLPPIEQQQLLSTLHSSFVALVREDLSLLRDIPHILASDPAVIVCSRELDIAWCGKYSQFVPLQREISELFRIGIEEEAAMDMDDSDSDILADMDE